MTTISESCNIAAVVVTFHPDITVLKQSLTILQAQVNQIIIVDNGSNIEIIHWLQQQTTAANIILQTLGANYGIATAQNKGIDLAQQASCTHVLLMDQDSIAATNMVAELLYAITTLQAAGNNVAAVGPQYIDIKTNTTAAFIRYGYFKKNYIACQANTANYLRVDTLIASGTLLSVAAFNAIGSMAEEFFIDNVDVAWCLAARAKQWLLYGVCTAKLQHNLGENAVTVWFFGKKIIPIHSASRLYYIIRNSLLLCRKSYSDYAWYLQTGYIILTRFFIFGLLVPPRLNNLRMMWRGLYDGMRGKTGALSRGKIAMTTDKLICVSIVSHGQLALIMPLLADLADYCVNDIAVILTINIPETIPAAITHYHFIQKIIHNATPKGFAANHNSAFQQCTSHYYCVLNPDIRLPAEPFTALLTLLNTANIGLVSALMLDDAGVVQDNARKFPTISSLLKRVLLKQRKTDYILADQPLIVDWVGGMFMLFPSNVYRLLNGFDEAFFLYFEDVDLCARLQVLGYDIMLNPQVKVIHQAQRRSHRSLRFLKWHISSMLRYFYRYYLTNLYRKPK